MPNDTKKDYPLQKFHFMVEWGGTKIGFTELSGLSFETEVIDYRDGSSPVYNKKKLPGLTKFNNIILKRGVLLGDFDMYNLWRNTLMFQEGAAKFRRDITIKLLDEEHKPVIVWALQRAWPCKVMYADLNANSNDVLIESMELVHEGLSIIF
ncbi:MAG: phage tail protein [Chitinophagaceae bacterium]